MQRKALLLLLVLALAPISVSANAGTALMWAGFLHLFLGNFLIGIFEGWLLTFFFKGRFIRCCAWMIAANYASTAAGFYFSDWIRHSPEIDLNSVRFWLWTSIVAAYFLTLLIEFPFVFFALGKKEKRFRKAIAGNFIAQTASSLLLFYWYCSAGDVSLLGDLKTVRLSEMNAASNIVIYCVPSGLDDVCIGYLYDGSFVQVATLPRQAPIDRLAAEEAGTNWNLVCIQKQTRFWAALTNLHSQTVATTNFAPTHMNFGKPLRFPGASTNLDYFIGFWAAEGITIENRTTRSRKRFAIETPFAAWPIRNATVLPDNKILFQLGADQICLMDFEMRKIALVLRGRGPVAALEP